MHALIKNSGEGARLPAADACLWPLLNALDWTGEAHHLSDALPDGHVVPDFESLVAVLARLDFNTHEISADLRKLDVELFPALLLCPDADIWLVRREVRPGFVDAFIGSKGLFETVAVSELEGRLFIVRREILDGGETEQGRFGWVSTLLDRERKLMRLLFFLSLVINCMALSMPLYMLSVFDLAIGARSLTSLATLAAGITIILCAEIALREVRARAIARLAVRMQIHVMTSVFERLMRLPVSYIQSASVAGQLNRLRTFESVRDIFSGSLAVSLLDLPFILIFVLTIFALGGSLGWIVVTFIVLLAALSAVFIPRARASTERAGVTRSESRLFRTDLVRHLPTIHDCGAENIWAWRYRELVARQLTAGFTSQRVAFTEQTLAQALSAITGALIVGFGAVKVIDGTLSMGALAAIMAIVWRVLAPIQTALLNLNRVFQAIDTAKQINQLMKLAQENMSDSHKSTQHLRGEIAFENVGYRSGAQGLPILRGIDMQIRPGQLIVLAGAPGPSRSVLLKLIAGLHQASVGRIRIDSCDVRQFDARELRRSIAYVSDEQIVFSDTLAQNLLFANPLADEDQIRKAIADADLTEFCNRLSDGLNTDLNEMVANRLSTAISQKIRLARAWLKGGSIYLFDEPTKDLDPRGQLAFINKIQSLKGRATMVIRTADPRIFNIADGIAYLQGGQLLGGRAIGKTPGSGEGGQTIDAEGRSGVIPA